VKTVLNVTFNIGVSISYQQPRVVMHCVLRSWSENMDKSLQSMEQRGDGDMAPISGVLQILEATLNVLADSVLHEQPPVRRKKLEHLVSKTFLVN